MSRNVLVCQVHSHRADNEQHGEVENAHLPAHNNASIAAVLIAARQCCPSAHEACDADKKACNAHLLTPVTSSCRMCC